MALRVFEYVAWLNPSKKELADSEYAEAEVLTQHPTVIVADDEKHALRIGIAEVHDSLAESHPIKPDLRLVDIRVREIV